MAECEICGRTLKTGRKYCYEHRGFRGDGRLSVNKEMRIMLFGFFLMVLAYISYQFEFYIAIFFFILALFVLSIPFRSLMPESFLPKYEILGRHFSLILLLIFYVFLSFFLYSVVGFGMTFYIVVVVLAFIFFLIYKKFSEQNKKLKESHVSYRQYNLGNQKVRKQNETYSSYSFDPRKNLFGIIIFLVIIFVGLIFIFIGNNSEKTQSQDLNQEEQVGFLSEEEQFLSFCKSEFGKLSQYSLPSSFSNINKTYYFIDYNATLSWIEERYPDEGFTINNARFFKEHYLDKAQFPIYIVDGKVKISQQVTQQGLYVCDKTGILKW